MMNNKSYFIFAIIFVLRYYCKCQIQSSDNDILDQFFVYIKTYNIQLENNSHDFNRTLSHFKENLKLQHMLNHQQPVQSAKYGVTKFSHLSPDEFKDLYLSDISWHPSLKSYNQSQGTPIHRLLQMNVPKKIDWRNYLNFSIVSPVKNQKQCGGCWAFSTVETVESMYAKKMNVTPPTLSVQQVIDCSTNNDACKGGDTCSALYWMVNTKTALVSDAQYPLTDTSDSCKVQPIGTFGIQAKEYNCYNHTGIETSTISLLQKGPVSAAVDATTWANYQGGIIQYHCGTSVNHAIQIVGYDLTGVVPYYIVRNSWGTDFGHDGYLYVKIGDNVCGIGSRVATVDV